VLIPWATASLGTITLGHGLLQSPKWEGFVSGSIHSSIQTVWGKLHVEPHVPPKQDCSLEHALPHAPQLNMSLEISAQVPSQTVVAFGQGSHWALRQILFSEHSFPQALQ
jgi:hypothetical protein